MSPWRKVQLPAHALGSQWVGMCVVEDTQLMFDTDRRRKLTAHGLAGPRPDGEQWFSLEIESASQKRATTLEVTLDAATARDLRDVLCRVYGPPGRRP